MIFDFAFFNEITDGDAEMQHYLLKLFIEQTDKDVTQMQHAINNGDCTTWLKIAHKIYGSAANIGASQLARSCNIAQKLKSHDADYHELIITQYQHLRKIISQQPA